MTQPHCCIIFGNKICLNYITERLLMGRKESNQTNKTTTAINGIARSLKKLHQRETTGSSSDFRQLSPFSKWELLLKERILEEEFFSLLEEEFFPL